MLRRTDRKILLALIAVAAALGGFVFYSHHHSNPPAINLSGYHAVGAMQHGSCEALEPDCGYCPGIISDNVCYERNNATAQ